MDIVVAGSRAQYDELCARLKLGHRLHRARYVEQPMRTSGMIIDTIFLVGTWQEKRETVAQLQQYHPMARLSEARI